MPGVTYLGKEFGDTQLALFLELAEYSALFTYKCSAYNCDLTCNRAMGSVFLFVCFLFFLVCEMKSAGTPSLELECGFHRLHY